MTQDDTGVPSDVETPAPTDTAMDITPKPGPTGDGGPGSAPPPPRGATQTPKEPTDTAMDITPDDDNC